MGQHSIYRNKSFYTNMLQHSVCWDNFPYVGTISCTSKDYNSVCDKTTWCMVGQYATDRKLEHSVVWKFPTYCWEYLLYFGTSLRQQQQNSALLGKDVEVQNIAFQIERTANNPVQHSNRLIIVYRGHDVRVWPSSNNINSTCDPWNFEKFLSMITLFYLNFNFNQLSLAAIFENMKVNYKKLRS